MLAAPAALAALSACARAPDLAPGETGRIAHVFDGDTLTLEAGLRVRLVEIEAPSERYSDGYASEAREALEAASVGRVAQLFYGGLSRDRYQRALAHVIASTETGSDVWLNGYMVRQGAARVRTYPDNARRVRQLLKLEDEARKAKRGLWALDDYRIRATADLAGAPAYAIVEGALLGVQKTAGDGFAVLTTAGVQLSVGDRLGGADAALKLDAGRPLRVRGRIEDRNGGPTIRITHWGQVETPEKA
jgi:endonuclease YncB( thermonuclease family)